MIEFYYNLFVIFIYFNVLLFIFLRDRIYYRFRDFINDDFDFDRDQILFALLLNKDLFINFLNKNKFSKIKLIVEKMFAMNTLSRR